MSVEAVHDILIADEETAEAERFVGTEGGVVSVTIWAEVVNVWSVDVERFPEPSVDEI